MDFRIGTSGYSFLDWIGPFYPTRTRNSEMFPYYTSRFSTVEINYTYYRMPNSKTLAKLTRVSPDGFDFWIKANGQFSHEQDLTQVPDFLDAVAPIREAGRLAGVLFQFPQAFHRTRDNRAFLARAVEAFGDTPLAVEFRHRSWQHAATLAGLRERQVSLVIPDVPPIRSLYQATAAVTTRIGYLRLHSRNADNWYDGGADRYDYDYTDAELTELIDQWSALDDQVDQVYVFFNNCHSGQAARNAESFRRLLQGL